MKVETVREWLETTVKMLVDNDAGVSVAAVEGRQAVILEVSVAPPDVRRVIGRKGRTADALREVLMNFSALGGRRFQLEIVEPPRGPGARFEGGALQAAA